MEVRTGLKRLREKAQRLHKLYEAMLVISNNLTTIDRQRLNREKQDLSLATRANLHHVIPQLEKAIADYRAKFGFKARNSELIDLLDKSEASAEGKLLRLTKDWIEDLCTGYNKYAKDLFAKLPAHALIEIDPGRYRTKQGDISWYWLEATVFEDMCALFNLAKEHADKQDSVDPRHKRHYKTGFSLNRSTVIVAFHFVEAYLNGLAFDYWIRNRVGMDNKTASLLLDWDAENDRPQYLSLRDKALKYPRIILGAQHPPIQESNCPELKFILERAKQIRDAITHVSPKREFEFSSSENSAFFYGITFKDVQQTIDSAIGLVRKLEKAIHGNDSRLFWLADRSLEGFFPDEVFK